MSRLRHHLTTLLLVLVALSLMACAPIEACDPESSEFDLSQCAAFLSNLTCIYGYGSLDYCEALPPRGRDACAPDLVCRAPDCLWLEENGSFEADSANAQALRWTGDEAATTIDPSCHRAQSLDFLATTPAGASASASAQVYQVIDLTARVPEAQRDALRRVRARASFAIQDLDAADDRQFGLRLHAYTGDPAAFPRTGDPETLPAFTDRYQRVASAADTLFYAADGPPWQSATAVLALPADADFVVVMLEHVEDVQNDTGGAEFEGHSVDYVQVALDGGNAPPTAVPDVRAVNEDATAMLDVLANDSDATSRLDGFSLAIGTPPANGTATLLLPGHVRYTPRADFNGPDAFTYTIADEEGLISNEATVALTVRPVNDAPVAQDDRYVIPAGGVLTVAASEGVLANDTDIDGDVLTAVLRSADAEIGTLDLDPSGAFTATVSDAFEGATTFTYRAHDADTTSAITLVTLTRGAADTPVLVHPLPDTTLPYTAPVYEMELLDVFAGAIDAFSFDVASGSEDAFETTLFVSTLRIDPEAPGGPFEVIARAENSAGVTADSFLVTVTAPGNNPPVAVDDTASTWEDTPVTINVLANDTDPDGDGLDIMQIPSQPANGTATFNVVDGVNQIQYQPNAGFIGTDTFTYRYRDARNNWSNDATVTVTVRPAADS